MSHSWRGEVTLRERVSATLSPLRITLSPGLTMDASVLKGVLQDEVIVDKVLETARVFFTNADYTVNAFPLLLYFFVSLALLAPFLLNLLEAPADVYGAPASEYGSPTSEYGAPLAAPSQEYGAYSAESMLRRRDPLEAIEALERKLNAIQDIYYNNQQGARSPEDIDYNIL